MTSPRVLLFDLYHQGHHSSYLRTVLEQWRRLDLPGTLDVVIAREMMDRVPGMVEAAQAWPGVTVLPVEIPGGLRPKSGSRAVFSNDVRIGRYLRDIVERRRPDHVVALYLDHLQASLATGLRFATPVQISGIYFRPAFHYRAMGRGDDSLASRVDDGLKRALLRRALANPHVQSVFALDPYAVGPIRALAPPRVRVAHLPEPSVPQLVSAETPVETRRHLGIEEGRRLLLLYGSLDARKGVVELLTALQLLPEALARRACLVMAGETTGGREVIAAGVEAVKARGDVQVVQIDRFVTDAEMVPVFAASDAVLLPYQHHVGSSNVLIRAAGAGVPVLGPTYGMLGARIAEHGLGVTVETTDPAEIARGLVVLLDPAVPVAFDALAADALARANTDEHMARTLLASAYPGTLAAP